MTGRQEGHVTSLGDHAATRVLDRLPAPRVNRSLLQANAVLTVLARAATQALFVHRKVEQFGITSQPCHHSRTFGNQRTH